MTFKESVIASLPEGVKLNRIYSLGLYRTAVETRQDNVQTEWVMEKINIADFFSVIPFMVVDTQVTYAEVYEYISNKFNLGLVSGIDYFNNETIVVGDERQYVQLPIMEDSYGYFGITGCYLVKPGTTMMTPMGERDLTQCSQSEFNVEVRVKTTLAGAILSDPDNGLLFIENRFTGKMIKLIKDVLNRQFPDGQSVITDSDLRQGVITNVINDGLTDIAVFRLLNGNVIFIRFSSIEGDLPVLTLKETEVGNLLDENSKESLSGVDGSSLEETGEKRGETITGKEEEELT